MLGSKKSLQTSKFKHKSSSIPIIMALELEKKSCDIWIKPISNLEFWHPFQYQSSFRKIISHMLLLRKLLRCILESLVAQAVKSLPAMRETRVQSLSREDPLEKEMATHSCVIAWKIPWMQEPGGYSPWGCKELDTTEQLHFLRCIFILFTPKGRHGIQKIGDLFQDKVDRKHQDDGKGWHWQQ